VSIIEEPPQPSAGFRTADVLTIAGGHAAHDTYTGFLPALLPSFIDRFLLSKTEAGLLAVTLQLPSLLQPVIGHLADRLGLRALIILAPAVAGILMSLLGVAPGYPFLLGMLLLVGLSSAGLHAVAPVLAGRLAGPKLGRGMSFFMVGGELGRTLGPVFAVTALVKFGVGGMPWLMAGGLAASAVLFFRLRRIPEPHVDAVGRLSLRPALAAMGPVLLPLTGVIAGRVLFVAALGTYLPTYLRGEGASLWLAGA